MTLEELYSTLHGNYDEAKKRLMMDKLVDKFVRKFPADPTMQQLRDAVAEGNIQDSFRAAHTLKGVAANLSFTELSTNASELTEQLRPQAEPADAALFAKVEASYQLCINTINQL